MGNPVFSCGGRSFIDIVGIYQGSLWYYHAQLPLGVYREWQAQRCDTLEQVATDACTSLLTRMGKLVGDYDPYDLYTDSCTGNSSLPLPEHVRSACKTYSDLYTAYLNRADVQAALHVIPSPAAAPVSWSTCADALQYDITWPDNKPNYDAATRAGKRMLVFSGDVDVAVCPFPTAQHCLDQFGSPVLEDWRQWTVGGYTAGYVRRHRDYTFATVKGAGHMAPTYQPWEMYNLLQRFLADQPL